MYLKKHKKGNFGIEIAGYLANLQVSGYVNKSKVCFVSGDKDCLTIGEVIKAAGYDPSTLINRRLLITIEDEIQPDAESRCPQCGETEPDLHCAKCGHSWYRTA